jgi:hypothetical protein
LRLVTVEHNCLDCERKVAPHEGPPTVRQFDFAVRDVAYTAYPKDTWRRA